jgi:hypothetical protein
MCINKNVCKGKKVIPWFQRSLDLYFNTFNIFIKIYINTQQHNHVGTHTYDVYFLLIAMLFHEMVNDKFHFSFIAFISNLVHPTICCLTISYMGMSPILSHILNVLLCNQLISRTKWIAHLFSHFFLKWSLDVYKIIFDGIWQLNYDCTQCMGIYIVCKTIVQYDATCKMQTWCCHVHKSTQGLFHIKKFI